MLLTIVVLSYNRPEQIGRIFDRLLPASLLEFNLVIKDDCSPRQREIEEVVEFYRPRVKFEVIFYRNHCNLGYDRNLIDAFNVCDSDYIFLLSDDDYVDGIFISRLIDVVAKREFSLYFTPYFNNGRISRVNIKGYDINRFHEVVYNSVLFSGLVFNRKTVLLLQKDEAFLSNCIYTQVYLASVIVHAEARFGEIPSGILYLGGDGENFFGKNQSAVNRELLQDRSSVNSNLRYQMLLLSVVDRVAKDTNPLVARVFRREYNRRLIGYLILARARGLSSYKLFAAELISGGSDLSFLFRIFMPAIYVLPSFFCAMIYDSAVSLLKKSG